VLQEGGRREGMKEFLEFVTRHLVDHPDRIHVELEERTDRVVLRLQVDPADLGKVIGKQGRNAQSLRTLVTAIAAREGHRVTLEIVQ
jgi:predicted RNA-binding protein YlqC (UPF0109 family)